MIGSSALPAGRPRASRLVLRHVATLALLLAAGGCSLLREPEETPVAAPVSRPQPPQPPAVLPPPPEHTETAAAVPLPDASNKPTESLPAPVTSAPPVSTRHYSLGPATSALVAQAQQAGNHGDYLTSMSTLERAVRIEPRNPLVWIEMSKVRLAAGEAVQAESVARKAVALSEGDQRTSNDAWKQVALALKAQNRNAEAAAADARASRAYVDTASHKTTPDRAPPP